MVNVNFFNKKNAKSKRKIPHFIMLRYSMDKKIDLYGNGNYMSVFCHLLQNSSIEEEKKMLNRSLFSTFSSCLQNKCGKKA